MKSIFKYYRGDDYSLDCLSQKYLWFSKPPYFNDPFDCSMEHLLSKESQLSNEGKEFIRTNTKEFGVCCFSEDSLNPHMWAHYANSYKGFCLEFDKEIIQSFCSDLFHSNCELLQCKYDEYPINLDERITWERNGDYIQEVPLRWILECPKKMDRLFQMLLLQKNEKTWAQEKEWRIILSGRAIKNGAKNHEYKSTGYRIPLPEGAIKSIILGPKMADSDRDIIESINRNYYSGRIEMKEIDIDHDNWSLKIKN